MITTPQSLIASVAWEPKTSFWVDVPAKKCCQLAPDQGKLYYVELLH